MVGPQGPGQAGRNTHVSGSARDPLGPVVFNVTIRPSSVVTVIGAPWGVQCQCRIDRRLQRPLQEQVLKLNSSSGQA
jgi:hypothetical protein